MKNCIKTELWKAFRNPMFYLSFGIAMIFILWDVYEVGKEVTWFTELTIDMVADGSGSGGSSGFSLAVMTIPYCGVHFSGVLYNLIWPLLAAIPFSWSYMAERGGGVYNQIVSRCGAKQYYIAKYIAVFASGGAAAALPILMDYLLCALVCPYGVLDSVMSVSPITNGYFLSQLYYTQPWLHGLIWCGVDFLWGGAAACLCFLVGSKVRLRVIIMAFPFALLLLWQSVEQYLHTLPNWFLNCSPLALFEAAPTYGANPEWLIFSLIGGITLVSFAVGYWQVVKHELV